MKAGKKDRVFELVTTVLLAVILIIALYPLYFSLIASISSPRAVYQGRVCFCRQMLRWMVTERYLRINRYGPGLATASSIRLSEPC